MASSTSSAAFRHYVRTVLAKRGAAATAAPSELPRVISSSAALHSSSSSSAHENNKIVGSSVYNSSSVAPLHDLAKCDAAFSFSFAEGTQFGYLLEGTGEIDSQRTVAQLERSHNQLRTNNTMSAPTMSRSSYTSSSTSNPTTGGTDNSPRTQWKGCLLPFVNKDINNLAAA
mmetsp:Transcript_29123/g.70211  ORF Transcript_29123/g.70211 Transcript_29123/m.70211 type:complete len:172 (+) Transcript_29123:175-690(+)